MSLSKERKHSNHHCSHEHIHEHNENINSLNTKKPRIESEKSRSQYNLPPKSHYTSEKPSLAQVALQQELEYYKTQLAKAEERERKVGLKIKQDAQGQIRAQLNTITRVHNKVKKQYNTLQKEHEQMIKKLNDLENKVTKGDRQIQSLKTIRSTKGESKRQPKKSPKKQTNPEIAEKKALNKYNTTSTGNLVGSTLSQKQLQEENRTLRQRLRMFEQANSQNSCQFQPILQENARQIRQMINEKNRYLSENAELKQKVQQLQSQSIHFEQKYNTLMISFQKIKNQYERVSIIQSKNSNQILKPILPDKSQHSNIKQQLKEAENKISELKNIIQNQNNHIQHLENTNRYLVGENKKLLNFHKLTINNLSNQRPSSANPINK